MAATFFPLHLVMSPNRPAAHFPNSKQISYIIFNVLTIQTLDLKNRGVLFRV